MSTNATEPRPQRAGTDATPSPDRSSRVEPTEQSSTPDAVRAARITRRADSERRAPGRGGPGGGVQWVRPTDLLARQSAALVGRGVDLEVELVRRTRSLPGQVARAGGRRIDDLRTAVTQRSRRLPDVSEFGRSSQHFSWVSRSGIGLG